MSEERFKWPGIFGAVFLIATQLILGYGVPSGFGSYALALVAVPAVLCVASLAYVLVRR